MASSAAPKTACDVDLDGDRGRRQPPRWPLHSEAQEGGSDERPHRSRARRDPSTTRHRGPAARGGKVGAAERRAEAVVDHLLRAHPLTSGQASVAERHGGAPTRTAGGMSPAARSVGAHLLLLARRKGGRIRSATACSGGSAERLDPRRREAGDDPSERSWPWSSWRRLLYVGGVRVRQFGFLFVASRPADGAPSRSSRWSPTRSALAIAVSPGSTAPRREEAGVDDVEVVHVVGLAVDVERGPPRIRAEAHGAALVRDAGDGDLLAEHRPARDAGLVATERTEQVLELGQQPPVGLGVVVGLGEMDVPWRSTVTRLCGSGRSSVVSQKSMACLAT